MPGVCQSIWKKESLAAEKHAEICWISFMVKKCAADMNWTYFLHLSTVLLILETAAQTTKLLGTEFSASARSTVAFIWLRAHMFGSAKQTTPIGHRILCASYSRTMSKQHRWMRRFSYDLLSIPEFFKDDALIDHSYKSYNPQIGTSLKILKCVLMCGASGKLVSGFNMIQQFQSWQSWPRQDSGHG
jgi:hypothetical protein